MSFESSEPRSDAINSDKLQFVKIGATFTVGSVGAFGIFLVPFQLFALYFFLSIDGKGGEAGLGSTFVELAGYLGIAMCVGCVLQAVGTVFCTLVPRKSGAKTVIDVAAVSLMAALCILIQYLIKKGRDPLGLDSGNDVIVWLGSLFLLIHYISFALFFNNLSRSFGDHNGTALAKKMLVAFIVLIVGTFAATLAYGNATAHIAAHANTRDSALTTFKVYTTIFIGSLLAMQIFAAVTIVQNVTNLNDTITRRLGRR